MWNALIQQSRGGFTVHVRSTYIQHACLRALQHITITARWQYKHFVAA